MRSTFDWNRYHYPSNGPYTDRITGIVVVGHMQYPTRVADILSDEQDKSRPTLTSGLSTTAQSVAPLYDLWIERTLRESIMV